MERRKRVLIVDDEVSNRELLEALLTGWGFDVDMACDGREALAKLDSSHDLILLDVMMAELDGYEVVRRIRAHSPVSDVPICMVTALSSKEERLRAVEAGANDFINKPIDQAELRVRTTSLLKGKEAQDAIRSYRVELERQNHLLQENYEQLRQLGEQKDAFVRMASHDLKNPLMCILGFVSILDSNIASGAGMTEKTQDWPAKIAGHCRVMQKIIGDFLDFQALEDGQIKLTVERVDINELVRGALERNADHAAEKGMTTRVEFEDESLMADADKSRVDQVLENLIGNAIKFGSSGQEVVVCTRDTECGFLVEVRDSGPGIAEEDIQKLFVQYARLGNKPTGGEKSTGLGLAICKKIVELQGGRIGARNQPGGGATFWFEIPQSAAVPTPM